jgi:hypothetical protein
MVAIETPYSWMANLTKVPLVGGILVLLIVLLPGTVAVTLGTLPFLAIWPSGVSAEVGVGISCLVSAGWAFVLQHRLRTTITVLYIPVWIVLPVLGVLSMFGLLD